MSQLARQKVHTQCCVIVPVENANNVPVSVHFKSVPSDSAFQFNRNFHFKDVAHYQFNSRMINTAGSDIVEIMRYRVCWCSKFNYQDNQVIMRHKGYALYLFDRLFPLPITWLIGRSDAIETAIDAEQFDMKVEISHPIFKVIYSYSGRFRITEVA